MPRIRPQDSTKRPGLSWASGKEIIGQDRIHKGLFIDTGLDDALDAAAAAAGWPVGDLSHMGGVTREHWFLPADAQLFVLIDGVPFTKMAALVKNDVSYAGVGARWPQGGKSALGVQMLIADLVGQGYLTPLIFTVSGTSTDDLLNALLAHDAVLSACESAAAANGKPRTFEFWEVALVLKAGDKVARGSTQTSMISPILCGHPSSLNVAYLRAQLAPKVVADVVRERQAEIRGWAADFARAGRGGPEGGGDSGWDNQAGGAPPRSSTPVHSAAPRTYARH